MHLTPFDFFQAGFPPVLFRQILYKNLQIFTFIQFTDGVSVVWLHPHLWLPCSVSGSTLDNLKCSVSLLVSFYGEFYW